MVPGNLRDALCVAGSPLAREIGAVICFDGQVLAPLGTTKRAGLRPFSAGAEVGTVCGGSFTPTTVKERPFLGPLPAAGDTPRVDIVAAYPGADATAIDAYIAAGAQGLVVEAMGHGNAGWPIVEGVRNATARGVAVVVTTRVAGGHANAIYGPGHDLVAAGAVMAHELRTSQARVLLMAALAARLPVADVVGRLG